MTRWHAMIMAGGQGTRFWPLSRTHRPKQVLPLLEGKALLRHTVDRISGMSPPPELWVVTGPEMEGETRACLEGFPEDRFLVEPEPRDTAPCVALASARILALQGEEAVLAFLPADHDIQPVETFRETLAFAFDRAAHGDRILTFGVSPSRPATGYGYIHLAEGAGQEGEPEVWEVEAFVEKPDLQTAKAYMAEGGYLWNSGLFVWSLSTLLRETAENAPELHRGIRAMAEAFEEGRDERVAEAFRDLPRTSIDYALLEKAKRIEVIPVPFAWDDLGSFDTLALHLPEDEAGNRKLLSEGSEALCLDSRNNVILSSGEHLFATLGIEDLVLIHTGDVTLVCPRERVEEIKPLVLALKDKGRKDLL